MYGQNIYLHLNRSIHAPPHTHCQENQDIRNTGFLFSFYQDQLIQISILAYVEQSVAFTVAIADSTKASWDALHSLV